MRSRTKHYSASEREELWERWKAGESLSAIARALERKPGTIHTALSARGGIAPPKRKRSSRCLSLEEREEISRGLASGDSMRRIANQLDRAPSTIAREVERNGGRKLYRSGAAERRAWKQALRPKACKLAQNARLRRFVAIKLAQDWSPEQISGALKRDAPSNPGMLISRQALTRPL